MVDPEGDQIAAALDQHGVAEGQPVDDLDLLGYVEAAAHRVGDAVEARERGLLLGLLEGRVAPDDQPQRAPRDSQRDAHELLLILLGDEAAPRLHEPAVMDVLGPLEGLARTRTELPLEEIPEGLLEDVADTREIALLDPADLDLGR